MTFRTMSETSFTYTKDNSATQAATTIVTPPAGSMVFVQLSVLTIGRIDFFSSRTGTKTVTIGGQAKALDADQDVLGPFMYHALLSDGSPVQLSISGTATNTRLVVTGKVFVIPPSNS